MFAIPFLRSIDMLHSTDQLTFPSDFYSLSFLLDVNDEIR